MDGEDLGIEFSEARGDFLKSLKKTYSRRKKGSRPKTAKERLKRAGGLIPIVALSKAGMDSMGRKKKSTSRRRPRGQERIDGPPKPLGQRARQKAKRKRVMKSQSVANHAKAYFGNE